MSSLKLHKYKILPFLFCLLFVGYASFLKGQMTQEEFGKNRVQYKNFIWSYYQTEHFSIYYYLGGQELGRYVVEAAEKNLKKIEKKLEYRINTPLQIIVYHNLTDLKQNNIGQGLEIYNTGGLTQIIGTKIFVYFNGSHADLERQLREGIARVFLHDMMYGGDIQDAVQNAVLLNLPEWFKKGLVSYAGESWNTELDNRLRDGILSGKYKKFHHLSGQDSRFAGHSIWYYIAEKYGESAIPNILYLTRINRSLESGFLFVLGKSVDEALEDWYDFYRQRYETEVAQYNVPADSQLVGKKPKRKPTYYQLQLSSDGEHIAYATNYLGRYKVKTYNKKTDKRNTLLRGGFKSLQRITDFSFPVMDWSPDGKKLAILFEKKDKIHLQINEIDENEEKTIYLDPYFQKVTGMAYAYDSKTLIISAITKGQSDIFFFHIPSRKVTRVTNDYYDDFDPHFIDIENKYGQQKKGVLFISNRPHDSLKTTKVRNLDSIPSYTDFNIFFYDYKTKSKQLVPITNTPGIQESDPMQYNGKWFSFLSDRSGIRNRYAGYLDTTFSHYDTLVYFKDSTVKNPGLPAALYQKIPNKRIDSMNIRPVFKDTAIYFSVTNRNRNILEQDISTKNGKAVDLMLHKGRYRFYEFGLERNLTKYDAVKTPPTTYRKKGLQQAKADKEESEDVKITSPVQTTDTTASDSGRVNIHDYFFQSEEAAINTTETHLADTTGVVPKGEEEKGTAQKVKDFIASKVRPYQVEFATDYVLSQLDNSIIFTPYQNFTGGGAIFNTPTLSPLIQISISDLFEDHRFTGGFRVPTNFSGSEYFLSYEHLKHRLDKKLLYYRKVQSRVFNASIPQQRLFTKVKMNYLEGSATWPFSPISSLRGYLGYRNDQITFQARDTFTLFLPDYTENWFLFRLAYVFDNTIKWATNTLEGTRLKIYGEARKMVNDVDVEPIKFKPEESHLFVFGADFRNYINLHRQIIFANRAAFSTSMGPRKVIYYLGGVDNWLFPKFNQETPIAQNAGYAFQALATNMRGFQQNIRNGNSFAVINSELRIPFFRYTNLFMNSEFFKNFQFIGFGDVGTAWAGLSPFSEDNPLNTEVIGRPPVEVRVDYLRNPIVQGYGFGARSTVLGYFLRFDVAWGLEDGDFNPPMYYLSLSLDF